MASIGDRFTPSRLAHDTFGACPPATHRAQGMWYNAVGIYYHFMQYLTSRENQYLPLLSYTPFTHATHYISKRDKWWHIKRPHFADHNFIPTYVLASILLLTGSFHLVYNTLTLNLCLIWKWNMYVHLKMRKGRDLFKLSDSQVYHNIRVPRTGAIFPKGLRLSVLKYRL